MDGRMQPGSSDQTRVTNEDNYIVMKGLPFRASEAQILSTIGTFGKILPWGHNGVIGVKFNYKSDPSSIQGEIFCGIVFITFANRALKVTFLGIWDETFYDLAGYKNNRAIEVENVEQPLQYRHWGDYRVIGRPGLGPVVWTCPEPRPDQVGYSRDLDALEEAIERDRRAGIIREPFRRQAATIRRRKNQDNLQ